MTQVFREDGTVVPVTRVQAGPCFVTQVRKDENGVSRIQIGFGTQKTFRLNKAEQGHLKDINHETGVTVRYLKESETEQALNRGDKFTVATFALGEKVKVIGTSKGKGFQGVVKRHGFRGGPASHGHKDNLRAPGSIGAGGVQRVFKGMRMAGHMGNAQITVKNLEIVEIHPETNEFLIKGALPGAFGSLVFISTDAGEITVEQAPPVEEQVVVAEESKTEAAVSAVETTEAPMEVAPAAENPSADAQSDSSMSAQSKEENKQ